VSALLKALAALGRNIGLLGLAVLQFAWSLALTALPIALVVLAVWAVARWL